MTHATAAADDDRTAARLRTVVLACVLGVIGLGGETRFVAEATELDRIFLALGYEVQFT